MGKQKDKPEMEHLSSIRVQKVVVDYIREKMNESKFNSISHGIERLSYIGMEVEKDRAKIVHSYETGFSIPAKKEKKEKK